MSGSLCEYWDWNPVLAVAVLLNEKKIDYLVIGSAAIHHHKLDHGFHTRPTTPPWYFTNIFEICIPDDDIDAAAKCLLSTPLFETLNPEVYDSMYEGTSRLIKLRASWTDPIRVKFILLPKSKYFVPPFPEPPESKVLSTPPLGDVSNWFEPRLQSLRIPSKQDLLLSLAHRAVAHGDHLARRSLARLPRRAVWTESIPVPSEWDEETRAGVSELLEVPEAAKQGDGKQADGKQSDARQADGKQADGKQSDARQADGKQADGKQTDARQADGKQADGKQTDGKQGDGKQGDGKQGDGKQGDGKQGDGKQGDGKQSNGRQGEARQGEAKTPLRGGDVGHGGPTFSDSQQGLPSAGKRKRSELRNDENKKTKADATRSVHGVPRSEPSGPA